MKHLAKAQPAGYATWLGVAAARGGKRGNRASMRLCREFRMRGFTSCTCRRQMQLRSCGRRKSDGLPVSVETCPHYLTFAAEEIADGATEFKCAPPIRERENREKLWAALGDGTIDLIATDHSPCPPAMKLAEEGDFLRAWGGIASLQLSLPAVWTQAASRGYAVPHLAAWLCERLRGWRDSRNERGQSPWVSTPIS